MINGNLKILFVTLGLVLLIILISFFSYHKIRRDKRNAENPDHFTLTIDPKLNISDFKIYWFDNLIFNDGKVIDAIGKEYGNNRFYIMCKDSLIATISQFKHNNWHGHDYRFKISFLENKLFTELTAAGPDSSRVYLIE